MSETVDKPLTQEYKDTPLTEVRCHPRNARKGSVTAILDSIQHNGFFGTCVAQVSTGHILVGNHRYLAAKEAGMDTLPVMWVHVDDKRALKILLADNRTNDLSSYDNNALTELLAEMSNAGELDGTGYSETDLDALIQDMASKDEDSTEGADETSQIEDNFLVVIECASENDQLKMLERFVKEGLKCKAIVS
jgi:ParB-like chromosome segregation protein Spo0J